MSTDNMVQATITFASVTSLPEDAVTNTFHFHQTDMVMPFPYDVDNVVDLITDFYTAAPSGGGNPLLSFMTTKSLSGAYTIKIYNMEDPKPRVPIKIEAGDWSGGMGNGTPLPAEVTLCMSYQAEPISGQPQARRRGRIFLPPVSSVHLADPGRPSGNYVLQVQRAAKDLKNAADASINWEWVVWSVKNNDHALVYEGWVDNAWDTQRRRGIGASSRNVWSDILP